MEIYRLKLLKTHIHILTLQYSSSIQQLLSLICTNVQIERKFSYCTFWFGYYDNMIPMANLKKISKSMTFLFAAGQVLHKHNQKYTRKITVKSRIQQLNQDKAFLNFTTIKWMLKEKEFK